MLKPVSWAFVQNRHSANSSILQNQQSTVPDTLQCGWYPIWGFLKTLVVHYVIIHTAINKWNIFLGKLTFAQNFLRMLLYIKTTHQVYGGLNRDPHHKVERSLVMWPFCMGWAIDRPNAETCFLCLCAKPAQCKILDFAKSTKYCAWHIAMWLIPNLGLFENIGHPLCNHPHSH